MSEVSGSLITRVYGNFRGVDFTKSNNSLMRSPDALNMWKNYGNELGKNIETRPGLELFKLFDLNIFSINFYTILDVKHMIIHAGVSLYDYNMKTKVLTKIKENGLNPKKSCGFVHNNIFFFKDGINYLEYNGQTVKDVTGYIPTTTISRAPGGGGKTLEDVNLLTGERKNTFCADGKSTQYCLDTTDLDSDYTVKAWVNDVETTDFSVDKVNGKITFNTAPEEPDSVGTDNVIIQFSKTVSGEKEKILKCTLLELFDNRIFFSGNQDYPNTIFHSSLRNPRYVSDLDFYNEGLDLSPITAMVSGNNALWVFKKPSSANTSIFYHNPATDSDYGKLYPSSHSSISLGCVATGINFNDDIVFFSDRGMEAITGDVTTEQVASHRSSLVDNKMLQEENYENLILCEHKGYLLVFVDNKVYLADSRSMFTNNTHTEYEWFYWELEKTITFAIENDGILYVGTNDGIYTLTDFTQERNITSYWTTLEDEFKYPQMQKTTNKKGCIVNMSGESILVSVKVDNKTFENIDTYKNVKGYIVARIKKKKWKSIQIKLSATKPFSVEKLTLESYVGSYVKR